MPEAAYVGIVRKLVTSVATVTAAAGLIAFATFGAFDNQQEPFPQSANAR